jgi:hypothetical protein
MVEEEVCLLSTQVVLMEVVHVQTELGQEIYLVPGSGLENPPVRDLKKSKGLSGRTGSFLCPTKIFPGVG